MNRSLIRRSLFYLSLSFLLLGWKTPNEPVEKPRVFKTLYQPIRSQADVSIQSPGEVNRQLRQRQIPIPDGVRPALVCIEYTSVEQLEQAVLVGDAALGFGQPPKLAMHRLPRVGRVNRLAHVIRVLEVGR